MKLCLRIMLLLAVFMLSVTFNVNVEAAKKTIAVTAVENQYNNSYGRQAARDLDTELTAVLVNCGIYNVVERAQLDHVIKELGLHSSGMINGKTAIQFGQLTGTDYSVIGNVVAADVMRSDNGLWKGVKAKIKMGLKFIDNKTGAIKIADIFEGSNTVSEFENQNPNGHILLSNAAKDVAKKVLARIQEVNPVIGNVLGVQGDMVYISIGSEMGARKNEQYVIFNEGNILTDPITGDIIGVQETVIGKVKVVEVRPKYSICEVKKSKGVITKRSKAKRG